MLRHCYVIRFCIKLATCLFGTQSTHKVSTESFNDRVKDSRILRKIENSVCTIRVLRDLYRICFANGTNVSCLYTAQSFELNCLIRID